MSGGVTGKAGDSLPMSIALSLVKSLTDRLNRQNPTTLLRPHPIEKTTLVRWLVNCSFAAVNIASAATPTTPRLVEELENSVTGRKQSQGAHYGTGN